MNFRTPCRYCPQYDGLIGQMTGYELLTMFARLRGVPESHVAGTVQEMVELMDLTQHASRPCGSYSGGNKRKISTAVALIGDPYVSLLSLMNTLPSCF